MVSKKTLAEYLGVEPGQILSMWKDGDNVVALVDKGIKGIPKIYTPLSDFNKPAPTPTDEPDPPEDEPEEEAAVSADTVDYADLTVIELQELARDRDIPYSGLRKSELIEALSD